MGKLTGSAFHSRSTPPLHGIPRKHTRGHTRRQPHIPTTPRVCWLQFSHCSPCHSTPERVLTGARARVGNASGACQPSPIWRKASRPKLVRKIHSNEPFAQSHSKQQTNLYGQCVRQMLQELRQNSRFVAKKLDTRRVSQARQAPGPRGQAMWGSGGL